MKAGRTGKAGWVIRNWSACTFFIGRRANPRWGNGSYSCIDEQRQQRRGNILPKRRALFRERTPPSSIRYFRPKDSYLRDDAIRNNFWARLDFSSRIMQKLLPFSIFLCSGIISIRDVDKNQRISNNFNWLRINENKNLSSLFSDLVSRFAVDTLTERFGLSLISLTKGKLNLG